MVKTLQDEIHQRKPFASLQEEATLNVVRTATALQDAGEEIFKSSGITGTQFNVLRILRGAEPAGLCRNELRDRMLTRMPDVTRLLDRMETAGLVERSREGEDRRMVSTRITAAGRALLIELDPKVIVLHKRLLRHITDAQMHQLVDLLTLVRNPP
jgi:DNA-binding MarR family transcriptional regulator